MTSHNNVTGDKLITKKNNDKYRSGWDIAFAKTKQKASEVEKSPLRTIEDETLKDITEDFKEVYSSDTCSKCGELWVEHDFGVLESICP